MTTMTTTSIKRTTEYDVEQIIDSIVLAFSSDPLARWVYPSPQQYLKSFPDFVKIFAGKAFEQKTAYYTDNYSGAALWLPPQSQPDGDAIDIYLQQTISERLAKIGIWGRPPLDADISIIPIPDSAIVRETEEYAAQMYGSTLNLHCWRTYFWGALIGKADGLKPDLELLYVASILHDLGLSETHSHKASSCCFAVTGAKLARDFVRDNGWDVTRSDALFEAISLHLNLNVSAKVHGTEARLLACGAHLDVVGSHIHRLSRRTLETVLKAYPRDGFVEDITRIMDNPHHSESRASFLGKLGFRKMASSNPLEQISNHRSAKS